MNETMAAPPELDDFGIEQAYRSEVCSETFVYRDAISAVTFAMDFTRVLPANQAQDYAGRLSAFLRTSPSDEQILHYAASVADTAKQAGLADLFRRNEERLFGPVFAGFSDAIDQARSDGWRTVVFIAHRPYFVILREAIYLRRNGFAVFLVTMQGIPDALRRPFTDHFDGVLELRSGIQVLKSLIGHLKPDVFHVQCWMLNYWLGRMVIEHKGDAAVVCEFYDVTSIYAERENLCLAWPSGKIDLDLAMEKYLLEHADGIVHRFPENSVRLWAERQGVMPPNIEMQNYVCPEFAVYDGPRSPRDDGALRLVYGGGLIPQDGNHPPALFPEAHQPYTFRTIVDQNLALDVFHEPNRLKIGQDPLMEPYVQLAGRNPRFRLLDGLPPDRVQPVFNTYDFGLILCHMDPAELRVRDELMGGVVGTKLFTYLEAGLPVVVNAEYREMARIVTENGLGLAVSSSEIGHLETLLRRFDRKAALLNIRRFTEEHCMPRQIMRLIGLYDQISR
jgi:hypothetical protein